MSDRMLRIGDVCKKVPVSRATIYRLVARGEFPTQVRASHKIALWREAEVDAWIAALDDAA